MSILDLCAQIGAANIFVERLESAEYSFVGWFYLYSNVILTRGMLCVSADMILAGRTKKHIVCLSQCLVHGQGFGYSVLGGTQSEMKQRYSTSLTIRKSVFVGQRILGGCLAQDVIHAECGRPSEIAF